MKMTKKCFCCGNIFEKKIKQSKNQWIKSKFCSRKCSNKFTLFNTERCKGNTNGKGHIPWNKNLKNIHLSPKSEFKKGNNLGEKHFLWKGENTGIKAKHSWIKRNYGLAHTCCICGATKDQKAIEWANKDHKYKREVNEWKQMCKSCHRYYDIMYNSFRKFKIRNIQKALMIFNPFEKLKDI